MRLPSKRRPCLKALICSQRSRADGIREGREDRHVAEGDLGIGRVFELGEPEPARDRASREGRQIDFPVSEEIHTAKSSIKEAAVGSTSLQCRDGIARVCRQALFEVGRRGVCARELPPDFARPNGDIVEETASTCQICPGGSEGGARRSNWCVWAEPRAAASLGQLIVRLACLQPSWASASKGGKSGTHIVRDPDCRPGMSTLTSGP